MGTNLNETRQLRKPRGWLTKIALVAFAAIALTDLTGCAALKNSADTLGNAAGTQVTKAGLWAMGKDADCHFDAANHSSYKPGAGADSGTVTHNGCRELPSTAAQVKLAEQQEAVYNIHFREAQKRNAQITQAQEKLRLEMLERQAANVCHQRKFDLLAKGKTMEPADACTTVLQQEQARIADAAPKPKSTGFWSGFTLKD